MDCSAKAAQLLASRPHFRAELATKLTQRGYPRTEVVAALDGLTAQGYLDDHQTAADFVAHRRERGGEGRLRLRAELVRRGAAPAAIEAALAGLGEDEDLAAARAAAERWSRGGREGKDAAALGRHLARKGFSGRAIVAVLKERPGAESEDVEAAFEGFEPE